jgi:hypothetical protein
VVRRFPPQSDDHTVEDEREQNAARAAKRRQDVGFGAPASHERQHATLVLSPPPLMHVREQILARRF